MKPPRDAAAPSGSVREDHPTRAVTTPKLGAGRVGAYAALGALAGAVPLPFVPDVIAARVRGALAQDIAARHGLSIAPDARDLLSGARPTRNGPRKGYPRRLVAHGARFVVKRVLGRFGPLAILPPVRAAFETFVLGHLFARYLEGGRTERAARIDVDEARRVRQAMDQAILHALRGDMRGPLETHVSPAEELRSPFTKLVDTALITAAGVPAWALERLEAAFDEVIPRASALR